MPLLLTLSKKLPKGIFEDYIENSTAREINYHFLIKIYFIYLPTIFKFYLSLWFYFSVFINVWNEIGPSFAWETALTALHNFANLCHSNKVFCSAGAFLFAWNKYVYWTEAATGGVI